MALSHTFSCTVADGTNTALVRPSDWNNGHIIGSGTSAYGLVPVGGVINWAGLIASVPTGYLVCDGSSLLIASYLDLYNAMTNNGSISPPFGYADATHFYLPDLRDKFVVGGNSDSSNKVKSNIRGSLEQSIAVTGVTLTHDGSVANHTGLTHAGVSVADHAALSHVAISIADHPSTQYTGTVGPHATYANFHTSGASTTAAITASTHAVTWPSQTTISHNISINLTGTNSTHAAMTHTITQPADHGTAGTVTHSFTAPAQHVSSIVPAFLAMPFIIRYA